MTHEQQTIKRNCNQNARRPARAGLLLATLLILGQAIQVLLSWAPPPIGASASASAAASNSASDAASATAAAAVAAASSSGGNPFVPSQRDSSPAALEIIKARGFIGELYSIKSQHDNTPLSVYHIINPHANQRTLNRYPVVVFHGVATDAASMVAHSERTQARPPKLGEIVVDQLADTSLALTLANNNFDVWLVDARGANLNNHLVAQDIDFYQSQRYWNFSLDEQVLYDLPAVIEFVLAQTHSDKVHYVGFSESTFFMFALLSRRPEYQSKLASYVALAPVAYVTSISGLALSMFKLATLVPDTINANFVPQPVSDTIGVGVRRVCNNPMLAATICALFTSGVAGFGDGVQSRDFYATLMKSTSIKAIKHFVQLYQQKRFGMYDYGPAENIRQYGTLAPPDYDLGKIKLNSIILFRGANDFLSNPVDQQLLLSRLGTKPYRDFNYPHYNHIDFLSGRTVATDVNLPAARLMLEMAKMNAAQSGARSLFKDPEQAQRPPGPHRPLVVVKPDGSRSIKFRSNLINNLVTGIIETDTSRRGLPLLPGFGGLQAALQPFAASSPAKTVLKQQWDMLQNVEDKVQNLGLGVDSRLPEIELPPEVRAAAALAGNRLG